LLVRLFTVAYCFYVVLQPLAVTQNSDVTFVLIQYVKLLAAAKLPAM